MNHQRIAVIGAGISGLSVANLLTSKGNNVVVFEKNNQIGGLVKCTVEDGVLFHRVGGHVFNTKIKKVDEWFWKYFKKAEEFLLIKRNAKIWMDNKYIGYPIENYLYQLNYTEMSQITSELLLINKAGIENADNFDDFLKNNFGETLYQLYFKPYNIKIWHTDLSLVPLPWLEGKLPMPKIKDIILNNIYKVEDEKMVHNTFYYPLIGGSSFIVDRLAQDIQIETASEISSIQYVSGQWKINEQLFQSVIFTGDVRTLHNVIDINDQNVKDTCLKVDSLLSNGTSNALCYVDDSDLSWLYLPEVNTESHRIIYTGNFSPNNNGDNRLTCTVEFAGILSEEKMKEALSQLPGNLEPIAFNNELNSYVIQQKDTRDKILDLKRSLQPYQFYLVGRFAEWEYYNMDKAIEASMNLFENHFS